MKTRSIISIIALVIGLSSLNMLQAQNDGEPQYLFQSENIQVSGFGGPTVGFSMINDEFAVFSGGGGAVLFNQKYFIGGYGEGLATMHRLDESVVSCPDKNTIAFGHGGFWLGYIYKPNNLIHFNVNSTFGWGGISLYDEDYDVSSVEHCDRDVVFVVSPSIEMEVNLTSWMKFTAGAGYRYVAGISSPMYSDDMFSQPNVRLGVMFGNFKPKN
jgi:hypothetical protein